jgi:hypothetical protein
LRQHLGLGKATALKRLEIRWPKSGKVQTLRDLPIDCTIRVVEGQDGCARIELPRTRLGGTGG